MAVLWLSRWPRAPRLAWWSTFLFATAFVANAFVNSPWAWLGIEWRYAIVLAYFAALISSLVRKETPAVAPSTAFTMIKFVLAGFFSVGAVAGVMGWFAPRDTIELHSPLVNGAYIVGQGGSTVAINYHHISVPQRYALDIAKLNGFGMRVRGFYPSDLKKYAIFGDEIHAPCDGKAIDSRDSVPDLAPPNATPNLPEGNFVKLDCGGTFVFLAHMRRGSVRVRNGQTIRTGEILGNVGNSGNTTEPHLHMHAERNGVGVAMLVDGRWLVRNSVFR